VLLMEINFSPYFIIEEIGSGGLGMVFHAHDQHVDREVAIKVLYPGTITGEGLAYISTKWPWALQTQSFQ